MRSTAKELTHFEQSIIWQDIVGELEIWLTELRDQMESDEADWEMVQMLRGSSKALRNVKNMLPNLAAIAEEEK